MPLTVLINPVVTARRRRDRWTVSRAACRSPTCAASSPASARCAWRPATARARNTSLETDTFFARVIQHECDHLDGSVYLDRMRDMRSLAFLNEFERFV